MAHALLWSQERTVVFCVYWFVLLQLWFQHKMGLWGQMGRVVRAKHWSRTTLLSVSLYQVWTAEARWKPLMTARWLAAGLQLWPPSPVPLYLPLFFFLLLPDCLWEICSLWFSGSCEMMAFCLEEEGDVNRDLSSLIVFIAQTQLSPPVTLWLSDST